MNHDDAVIQGFTNKMNEPVPLTGKALRSFERDLTLWALKMLWRGMIGAPRSAVAQFRAALALRKISATYMPALKPVRLGRSVKVGLYMPHWPGQALDTRVRRAINSNGVHHHEQVMLSVTDACPYKCPHCFNYRKAQPPMPIDRLRELVGEIQDVGGSWVCIHGGEPLVDIDRTMAVVEAAGEGHAIRAYVALAYGFGHLGQMLSPLHVCQIMSNEYFGAAGRKVYRRLLPSVALMAAATVAYFALLKLALR